MRNGGEDEAGWVSNLPTSKKLVPIGPEPGKWGRVKEGLLTESLSVKRGKRIKRFFPRPPLSSREPVVKFTRRIFGQTETHSLYLVNIEHFNCQFLIDIEWYWTFVFNIFLFKNLEFKKHNRWILLNTLYTLASHVGKEMRIYIHLYVQEGYWQISRAEYAEQKVKAAWLIETWWRRLKLAALEFRTKVANSGINIHFTNYGKKCTSWTQLIRKN